MARDVPFQIRHTTIPAVGEATDDKAIINRLGSIVVTDFYTQLVLSGFGYHIQVGTEDAPVAFWSTPDDVDFMLLADNSANYAMMPLLCRVTIDALVDGASALAYLEVDKLIVRYSTSGTAFVPANLRTDDPNSASGSFYTGVGAGGTAAGKSAVPNSVELARHLYFEDNVASSSGGETENTPLYAVSRDAPCVIVDVGSILLHWGASATPPTGYAILQFAQFSKTLVV